MKSVFVHLGPELAGFLSEDPYIIRVLVGIYKGSCKGSHASRRGLGFRASALGFGASA